jgi:hypothetical protein
MSRTHLNELPLWELESQWTPKYLENNYKGQNPLDWNIPYIIKKFLEHKCLKWAHMTHLDTSNASYVQKKDWESNCEFDSRQFDSRPLKVSNHPDFLACRWRVTYRWKVLNEGYNFSFKLHLNQRSTNKIMGPKVAEITPWQFQDSHLGVSKQNAIWVLVMWTSTKYTIRWKGMASPKSGPWWMWGILAHLHH